MRSRQLRALCVLGTLATSALFGALGTSTLVAGSLAKARRHQLSEQRARAPIAEPPPPPGSQAPDPKRILARNVFDPSTGALWPPKPAADEIEPEVEPEPEGPVACEGDLRLEATVYNHRSPERSVAVLSGSQLGPRRAYHAGMEVGTQTLAEIYPEAVLLAEGDTSCWLGLFTARSQEKIAQQQKARAKAGARRAKRAAAAFKPGELERGIHPIGKRRFRVDRGLLAKAVQQSAVLARSIRTRTVRHRGRAFGTRVDRLDRAGVLARLGIRRGDVVRSLNGFSLGTPAGVISALSVPRHADRVTLALVRRGRHLNFDYELR